MKALALIVSIVAVPVLWALRAELGALIVEAISTASRAIRKRVRGRDRREP